MDRSRLQSSDYSVAWVSALSIEWAAAEEMLDEQHEPPELQTPNIGQYIFGRIGHHNIVLACLPSGQMGNDMAASVITQLASTVPSIKFALMVGIAGGVPAADVRLGDVVIGRFVNAPPKVLLNAIARLQTNHHRALNSISTHLSAFKEQSRFSRKKSGPDVLFPPTYLHQGPPGSDCRRCNKTIAIERPERQDREQVMIHYGTIASANTVMKDGVSRDRISAELGGVLCFEMEGAGMAKAFPTAVIRGVCDYADSHKVKSWQPYASATAAAVAKELLLLVPALITADNDATKAVTSFRRYRLPFSLEGVPTGRFADRPKEMQQLEQALLPHHNAKRRKILTLHGLGGMGKTQLAVEFTRKHQTKFTSIFWLNGASEDGLKQSIARGANRIRASQLPSMGGSNLSGPKEKPDINAVVQDFKRWLSNEDNQHWLVVFDNVDLEHNQKADDDAFDISTFIPNADHGSVLITTRLMSLQLGESLHLGRLEKEQARAVFRKWYDRDFDPSESEQLLNLLDGLPLALAQAATYMKETGASFNTYTRLYENQWGPLMKSETMAADLKDYSRQSVTKTWLISYDKIRSEDQSAANLLLLWAHLDNRSLPAWIFQDIAANEPNEVTKELFSWLKGIDDEVQFLRTIQHLRRYCLVESVYESSTHRIHPVVQQWAFHIQDESQRMRLSRLAIRLIASVMPDEHSTEYHPKQQQLAPHAEHWLRNMTQAIVTEPDFYQDVRSALQKIGTLLFDRGNFSKAEKAYQFVLEGSEKVLGHDHIETVDFLNQLGIFYFTIGKLDKAEEALQRSLAGREKMLGPDDTRTLDTINNLGNCYQQQGKIYKAEGMYTRALEGKEKAWGRDHLETLSPLNNLALLYASCGKRQEAEKIHLRVLKVLEKTYGQDDTKTLSAVGNLAALYVEQLRMAEAEKMYDRVIKGYEKSWGANHVSTFLAMNNMANVYSYQGKMDKAMDMLQRALDGFEKTLGPNHPSTLAARTSLGYHYIREESWNQAEESLKLVLWTYDNIFSPNHPETINIIIALIIIHIRQGKLEDASKMMQRWIGVLKRMNLSKVTMSQRLNFGSTWVVLTIAVGILRMIMFTKLLFGIGLGR